MIPPGVGRGCPDRQADSALGPGFRLLQGRAPGAAYLRYRMFSGAGGIRYFPTEFSRQRACPPRGSPLWIRSRFV